MSDFRTDFSTLSDNIMTSLGFAGDDSLTFFLAGSEWLDESYSHLILGSYRDRRE